jgi:hypothetical protein
MRRACRRTDIRRNRDAVSADVQGHEGTREKHRYVVLSPLADTLDLVHTSTLRPPFGRVRASASQKRVPRRPRNGRHSIRRAKGTPPLRQYRPRRTHARELQTRHRQFPSHARSALTTAPPDQPIESKEAPNAPRPFRLPLRCPSRSRLNQRGARRSAFAATSRDGPGRSRTSGAGGSAGDPGAERADESPNQYPDDPKGGHDVDPS